MCLILEKPNCSPEALLDQESDPATTTRSSYGPKPSRPPTHQCLCCWLQQNSPSPKTEIEKKKKIYPKANLNLPFLSALKPSEISQTFPNRKCTSSLFLTEHENKAKSHTNNNLTCNIKPVKPNFVLKKFNLKQISDQKAQK